MRLNSWLTSLFRHLAIPAAGAIGRRPRKRSISAPASIERLESRQLLSVVSLRLDPPEGTPPQSAEKIIEPVDLHNALLPTPAVPLAGPETRVNTSTAGDQTDPVIATDAHGDYVVVWTSNGPNHKGIYAQRYSANGTAEGSEFLVASSSAATSSNTVNSIGSPSVAMDAAGDFVITWEASVNPASVAGQGGIVALHEPEGIFAQRYNSSGVAEGSPFEVSSTTSSPPAIAMAGAGDFVIAWEQSGAIEEQRYNAAGTAQGHPYQILSSVSALSPPSVAMDPSGDFVISWTGTKGNSNFAYPGGEFDSEIYAQRFNAAGVAQGSEFNVSKGLFAHNSESQVAMDAAGEFVITWVGTNATALTPGGNGEIAAQFYSAAGIARGNPIGVVNDSYGNATAPAVAMDAAGGFVVTWQSYGVGATGSDIDAQLYSATGTQLQHFQANTYTTGNQNLPGVAMDRAGDFVIAWESAGQDGSGYGIYTQRYTGGPTVTSVLAESGPQVVNSGDELTSSVTSISVVFSEALNTEAGGANSVTNRSNWHLTEYDADVSNLISGITFGFNATLNEYVAVVTFSKPLPSGGYLLVARHTIQDLSGLPLNGATGQDFSRNFYVATTLSTGPQTRINTSTVGDQSHPVIAMDARGDYVVVWASNSPNQNGIYAQRYSANGIAVGSQFTVASYPAGTTSAQAGSPSVAMDAAGDFVVTWQVAASTNLNVNLGRMIPAVASATALPGVFERRYNAAGVAQGSVVQVGDAAAKTPTVAMDAAGNFVVAWSDGTDIEAQRFTSAGISQGAAFLVDPDPSLDEVEPSVAMDPIGSFIITWSAVQANGLVLAGEPTPENVEAQRYNAAGTAQGSEVHVTSGQFGANSESHVAMNATGGFVVTWDLNESGPLNIGGEQAILARIYNAAGVSQGNVISVVEGSFLNPATPALAMDSAGDFVITWSSYNTSNDVFASRYSAAGTALGNSFPVNTHTTGNQQLPAVAMDAAGDFVIVWESAGQDGSGYAVYAQRYRVDVAPLLYQGASSSPGFTASQPVAVDPSLMVFDHDAGTWSSATIKITGNYQNGQDQLLFTNTAKIKGSWNAAKGTLTLTGIDSLSDYRTALQSVQFLTTSTNTAARTISFQTFDGILNSNVVSQVIVAAPEVSSFAPEPGFTPDSSKFVGVASTAKFDLKFSEPVTGVTANDFTLAETDGIKGGVITVSGSGSSYVLTVTPIQGSGGTVGIDLTGFASILDAAKHKVGSGFNSTLLQLPPFSMASLPPVVLD